ncbi:MAG: DUF3592 domain-containing protein [Steroidobacter sp.]
MNSSGPILAVILGGVLILYAGFCYRRKLIAKSWPVTDGVLLSAEVRTRHDVDGALVKEEFISYEYRVGGRRYASKRVALGVDFRLTLGDTSTASERFNMYGTGKSVRVNYNPHRPSESCLTVGSQTGNWILMGIGLMIMLMGISNL